MKRVGLILFGFGLTGFLISGSGLDGQTFVINAILAVASLVMMVIRYGLLELSEHKEALEERRRKEIEATEKAVARSKEATFQVWLESCRLDV